MSVFRSPEEHHANPPETWTVAKRGTRWELRPASGEYVLDSFRSKRDAEEGRTVGRLANLYATETRWYAGDSVAGWRDWKDVQRVTPPPA
jgi:hypothetical protein